MYLKKIQVSDFVILGLDIVILFMHYRVLKKSYRKIFEPILWAKRANFEC